MNENIPPSLDASLIEAWNRPERLPDKNAWLETARTEAAQAQYAFLLLKQQFAYAGVPLKRAEVPTT